MIVIALVLRGFVDLVGDVTRLGLAVTNIFEAFDQLVVLAAYASRSSH